MSGTPTSPHASRYRGSDSQGRLHSDVFLRNAPPLVSTLAPWLSGRSGPVLEIGSGTGQHAAAFALAFPDLEWCPSDPDAEHRASISAWAAHLDTPSQPPRALDAARDWAFEVSDLGPLAAVAALNVIHIAPRAAMEGLVADAGRALRPGGLLILYGPFLVHGDPISDGNRAFDRNLRADNPEWGLRDTDEVESLGRAAGLSPAALVAMPANNRLLILRR